MWWHLKTGSGHLDHPSHPHRRLFSSPPAITTPGSRRNGSRSCSSTPLLTRRRLLRPHALALLLHRGHPHRRIRPVLALLRKRQSRFLGALTIWIFGTIGFAVRPQMVGYLLLISGIAAPATGPNPQPALVLCPAAPVRPLGQLPWLFLSWPDARCNVLLFSSWLSFQSGSARGHAAGSRAAASRMLALALALSLLAVCFSIPVGIGPASVPVGHDVSTHPSCSAPYPSGSRLQLAMSAGSLLLATLGAIVLLVIIRRQELFWHEALLIALATWIAGAISRLVFPAGILIAPCPFARSWPTPGELSAREPGSLLQPTRCSSQLPAV